MENQVQTTGTQLAEFSQIEAGIAALRDEYKDAVYDVTTKVGMKDAKAAKKALTTHRTDLEKVRTGLKSGLLERGRLIDSEAKKIKAAIVEIEEPIAEMIMVETNRIANEKAEEERKEVERLDAIRARVEKFAFPLSEFHPSEDILKFINALGQVEINDSFGELEKMAGMRKAENLEVANAALDVAVVREKEAARVAEESRIKEEEMAEQRKALAEQKAKDDEAAAKKQAKEDAKQAKRDAEHRAEIKAMEDRAAEELEKNRAAQKVRDDEHRAEREAQEAKLQAQRDKEEAERKERQRIQDEEDAAKREEERKERDRLAQVAAEAEETARQEALAAKLSDAKCDNLSGAMKKIGDICSGDLTDTEKLAEIEVVVVANL